MEQGSIHRVPDGHSPTDQKCNRGKIHPSTYPQNRLKSWKAGHYDMLVQETAQEAIAMIPTSASTKTQEQREKIFANLMLQ
eukprot:scaffold283358_cov24-Attheya_sp.AAC.1